ncbi:pitrilysin family protein [Pseudomonas sp. RP23018S]|uniref:M16 family metallopeptidase n=1 Tax=Pseudomonas sp. RP23018S TaxID=3096037 RepID=UPI002AC9FEFF|nr:pitrilysin family protein [Pseudomonas sp. RP23018S]MDZ5603994.1 pitrilysin family protein [Pseudomonas sp. RP23018S]
MIAIQPASRTADDLTCIDPERHTEAIDFGTLESVGRIDLSHLPSIDRPVHRWQTAHDSRVRFIESAELEIIDIVLRFDAGSRLDGPAPGLAAATLYMLDQGADHYDAQGLATAFEDLGASVTRQVHRDHATLSLRCLNQPDVLEPALHLLSTLLSRPRFDAPALDKIKARLLAHLSQVERNPASALQRAVLSQLFADHPYESYVYGTVSAVSALTQDDLRTFHRRAYSARNVDIAVVGNLSLAQAHALTGSLSAALTQDWAAVALPTPRPSETTRRELPGAGSGVQAMLAMPLQLHPGDPDHAAMVLGCKVLGGGLGSRLSSELRERRALSYDISAVLTLWRAGGVLRVEWDIAAQYTEASRRRVLAIIGCLVERGPSAAELERALNQYAGELLLTAARNDRSAAQLAEHSQLGLPVDYLSRHLEQLQALTPAQVHQALQRWIDVQRMSFFTVGPRQAQQHLPSLADA